MHETVGATVGAVVDRLLEGVEGEIGSERVRRSPPHDPSGIHVDHERYVDESAPRSEWSKRQGVVELSPRLSSPNRTCTSQRIRLSIQEGPMAMATSR